MNPIIAYIYIFVIIGSGVLLWVKHLYLVYKLNIYMKKYHDIEWETLKKDNINWLGLEPWPSTLFFTYYSKAAYKFIWHSDESFEDHNIVTQRRRIRRIVWELPLWFMISTIITLLLILTGILK